MMPVPKELPMIQKLNRMPALTLTDLVKKFGPLPAYRICTDPPPGTATEQDVIELHDRGGRLLELVDGVLVEKAMGLYESWLAMALVRILGNFVVDRGLGIVTGEAGTMRLMPGLVRIPDVAFISLQRLPGGEIPRQPIPNLAPDLAVEVLSESNTKQEMERKLRDYFRAGVQLVWYIDPKARTVRVYSTPSRSKLLGKEQILEGGQVLPGFALPLGQFFDQVEKPSKRQRKTNRNDPGRE
jgi:Uma2 family endonuclease